jgi:hypothetical protein
MLSESAALSNMQHFVVPIYYKRGPVIFDMRQYLSTAA